MNLRISIIRARVVAASLVLAALTPVAPSAAQSALSFTLPYGPHSVGYRSLELYDRSRNVPQDTVDAAGDPVTRARPRPIHVSMWYPARVAKNARTMRYGDYLGLYAPPLHFASPGDAGRAAAEDAITQWTNLLFPLSPGVGFRARRDTLKAAIARERDARTHAVLNAPPSAGNFPIVIYTAGADGPSFENDVLMEYLASRGYLVLGVPCWGTSAPLAVSFNAEVIESVSRDIEFVLGYARARPSAETSPVALAGWSCGGMASVTVANRNASVDAVVGLDASVRYFYSNAAFRSKFAPGGPYTTPFLFLNQGGQPMSDLARAGADTTFTFFDSLRYADAYVVTMKNLRHQNFASLYNRLAWRHPAFVSDRRVASEGYMTMARYVATFLDAYLKEDTAARAMLAKSPEELRVPDTHLTIERKRGHRPYPSIAAFRNALGSRGWEGADEVLTRLLSADPAYTLERDLLEIQGSSFLEENKTADGLGVYRVYARLHPQDPRAWNGLGDAYTARADTTNAVASFKEALKVRPENPRATASLKRLGK